ncbi:hypothetical protein TVAG_226760 [Trichomonas vaginalis G3]|uniref:DUF3447 domain-containing protein n=1 Tax=Trichomonas vaginalis (strain ATCC PRA-98 / G3) TaxID=412133 RepID=A2FCC0_TRIV3|nr:proteasome regulatory particle assembly [Trichomonas vaginalis G3]EAX97432.1 hypothetical protein TVAG_226760 [Trichomonas vaginalis G3]KAI5551990.1 proteasome regulatory particle assembly [Trichomonas vaginalis G3]|eukprot:XP_001310362.1 hypothetical protein [Trichomonas vaginalis G3]
MHDKIDDIKEYLSNNSLKNFRIEIPQVGHLPPLEACCYFGSVNIFFFLISIYNYEINKKCLRYSVIGGNINIIDECMKSEQIDKICMKDILSSHNNKLLEYVLGNDLFDLNDEPYDNGGSQIFNKGYEIYHQYIIKSQNLMAEFLLYQIDGNSIFPRCAAFPQLIDIIKKEYWKHPPRVLKSKDGFGRTVLHYAAEYACIETVKFLISHGVDINIVDMEHKTALHYAIVNDNKEIVEYLISQNADISAKDPNGMTVLHYTAAKNRKEIAEFLILHGSDINVKDKYGETPLHSAISWRNFEIAEFLISSGADINEKDKEGKTALHNAYGKENCKEITEFLVLHGADIRVVKNIKN